MHLINGRLQLTHKTLQVIKLCWLLTLTVAMSIGCNGHRALATLHCLMAQLPAVVAAAMKRRCTSQLHWRETRMRALLNSYRYRYKYRSFHPMLVSVGCSSKCRYNDSLCVHSSHEQERSNWSSNHGQSGIDDK